MKVSELNAWNGLDEAIDRALAQTDKALSLMGTSFKYSVSEHLWYPKSQNVEWTTGFWTGELNLAYELSGRQGYLDAVSRQMPSWLDRIENRIDVDHHDMGFLYSPSCVGFYQLTGSHTARKAALLAADNLVSRFQEKGQFIQAWGKLGDPDNYRLIIDCLLNLPLLFWATRETDEKNYRDVALRHLHTALPLVMRPDHSTVHTYFFDPKTGKPTHGRTAQGYRDGSAWARGQAWGVYGSALAWRETREQIAYDDFYATLDFFLSHLPSSVIPFWDFDFSEGSGEPRDSSSLAIVICGMLEMADHETRAKEDELRDGARRLCGELFNRCAVKNPEISDGQLLHGTYARKSPYNTVRNRGVDECNVWGDYYYLEALRRLKGGWKPYW